MKSLDHISDVQSPLMQAAHTSTSFQIPEEPGITALQMDSEPETEVEESGIGKLNTVIIQNRYCFIFFPVYNSF